MDLTLTDLINNATSVVVFATPIALVLFVFFWNLAMLMFDSANPEKLKQARARILWSVVGMFVVFSLAGLLAVLQMTFFGETEQAFVTPTENSGGTLFPERAPERAPVNNDCQIDPDTGIERCTFDDA